MSEARTTYEMFRKQGGKAPNVTDAVDPETGRKRASSEGSQGGGTLEEVLRKVTKLEQMLEEMKRDQLTPERIIEVIINSARTASS